MKETSRSEANLKLQPQEVELVGTWLQEHGKVRGDISCQRIKWLTENHLHNLKLQVEAGKLFSKTRMISVTGSKRTRKEKCKAEGLLSCKL